MDNDKKYDHSHMHLFLLKSFLSVFHTQKDTQRML